MKASRELTQEIRQLRSLLGAGGAEGMRLVELTDDKGQQMFVNIGGEAVGILKADKGGKTKITMTSGASTSVAGTPTEVKAILEA